MKPLTPHDPLDELMAAALHGELTPEERAQFESRLTTDPAAQAAYQEAKVMHDLLEKTHKEAQPDPAFEQRMVSGVRRKIQTEKHRETVWESLVALLAGLKTIPRRVRLVEALVVLFVIAILSGVALGPVTNGIKKAKLSAEVQEGHAIAMAEYQAQVDSGVPNPVAKGVKALPDGRIVEVAGGDDATGEVDITDKVKAFERTGVIPADQNGNGSGSAMIAATGNVVSINGAVSSAADAEKDLDGLNKKQARMASDEAAKGPTAVVMNSPPPGFTAPASTTTFADLKKLEAPMSTPTFAAPAAQSPSQPDAPVSASLDSAGAAPGASTVFAANDSLRKEIGQKKTQAAAGKAGEVADENAIRGASAATDTTSAMPAPDLSSASPASPAATPALVDGRKLIRNAQLDLEVKSYQDVIDQITTLTRAAGGYVDTSNSQKGGNGKLQGTVVVKVLPQNLDAFLIKLRDLGEVQNQSVSTDDVTKDYFDTQARLANSQRMETQLQDLLKRENGKVSDLLAVERELGRVRGEIEQSQGQIKLYDFEVQYATVTMNMREKDLNQAAAYLLKEQDDFSLYSANVENTFQKARAAADSVKAQVLAANLNHNSGTDVSAELMVMVAPDQVETFLAQIRSFGRVANFTRQTQRVARDGGDSTQPADQTATEKDKVQVHVVIRYDHTTAAYLLKEQDDFSLYATDVELAFEQARKAADDFKAQVLAANLNHTSGADVSAELMVMVAPDQIEPFLAQVRSLGRIANFTRQTQRVAQAGSGGDQPADETKTEKDKVQVHLAIRSDDETRKQVALTVVAKAVDVALDQAKAAALTDAGTEIISSSLNKTPAGASTAQLSVRVPGKEYAALIAAFNALGRTASLSIQRNDDSGPGANGDDAPVIVSLALTDDDTPMQETQLTVGASDVDAGSQQIKKAATDAGVEVKASSFERQPDGSELAQMTFRLPMAKYPAFLDSVKALGKVESLTVRRDDRPDQTRTDDTAPAEISLQLHNQHDLVPDNTGLWATLRETFGRGAAALFSSVEVIGVIVAFTVPWVFTLGLLAWAGRRIYIWRTR